MVRLGSHNLNEKSKSEVYSKVDRISYHADFDWDTFYNDVAMIRLKNPVPFSTSIQPICVANKRNRLLAGTLAVVAGWGATGRNI